MNPFICFVLFSLSNPNILTYWIWFFNPYQPQNGHELHVHCKKRQRTCINALLARPLGRAAYWLDTGVVCHRWSQSSGRQLKRAMSLRPGGECRKDLNGTNWLTLMESSRWYYMSRLLCAFKQSGEMNDWLTDGWKNNLLNGLGRWMGQSRDGICDLQWVPLAGGWRSLHFLRTLVPAPWPLGCERQQENNQNTSWTFYSLRHIWKDAQCCGHSHLLYSLQSCSHVSHISPEIPVWNTQIWSISTSTFVELQITNFPLWQKYTSASMFEKLQIKR